MKTYKVVFQNNRGSFAIDAIAASVGGEWHNTVTNYNYHGDDIGFITLPDENVEELHKLLNGDENVVSFRQMP